VFSEGPPLLGKDGKRGKGRKEEGHYIKKKRKSSPRSKGFLSFLRCATKEKGVGREGNLKPAQGVPAISLNKKSGYIFSGGKGLFLLERGRRRGSA